MKYLLVLLIGVAAMTGSRPAQAQNTHPCAAEAIAQADKLLRFHRDNDDRIRIEDRARTIGTIRAIRGDARYDVLEVLGTIYRGSYRMRLIYAQIPGCVLMGQEVLEDAIL